jgi:hypothetical protein
MIEWTKAARAELESYFVRTRAGITASGADNSEVEEDLRRHIDQEISNAGLKAVAEDDVRRILARIGTPEVAFGTSKPKSTESSDPSLHSQPPLRLGLLVFGVVLPFLTLGIELATHMCGGAFFDPIPNWGQTLLVAAVPITNLLVWCALRSSWLLKRLQPCPRTIESFIRRRTEFLIRFMFLANAVAAGVSLFFAVLFLPLIPFAAYAIVFFGLGLLPMSPLFAFVSALRLRHHFRTFLLDSASKQASPLWRGAAIGFGAALLFQLPASFTQMGLQMASSPSSKTRAQGVRLIRSFGDREVLLQACYGRTRRASNMDLFALLFSDGSAVSATDARNTFYRVTGRAFNSVPAPRIFTGRGRWNVLEEEFTWDTDQGGDAVAGRVKGLSLVSSRQDGFVEADSALGYVEWTLEFKNQSTLQREARGQILLPPGGVVSRLTLWINGEEREAAFGGRSQVREAYQQVVTQRRDPVLVTTCGPDRVLVQCFPVPPSGGLMKVRIGITVPLTLTKDEAEFRWPCFLERNFTLDEEFRHHLWLDSKASKATVSANINVEQSSSGKHTVRGALTDNELGNPENTVVVRRTTEAGPAWAIDARDDTQRISRQTIQGSSQTPPARVVFVIDGSAGMDRYFAGIAAALTNLPSGIEFAVLPADETADHSTSTVAPSTHENRRRAADAIRTARTLGGQDNIPALTKAWDLAAESTNGIVVWIHGPQPVLLDDAEPLHQRFQRRPGQPVLYDLQAGIGPDRIAEKLNGIPSVKSLPRRGSIRDDLERLVATWNPGAKSFIAVRERLEHSAGTNPMPGSAGSSHLVRLWAREEIQRLVAARKMDEAVRLAHRYQLVTPVSGAVVLETKAQYQAAGLQPVDAETVPAVPEPSTWLMLLAGGVALTSNAWYRRKRKARHESGH